MTAKPDEVSGRSIPRVDADAKVRGAARYVTDLQLPPGTLHGAWVGSQVARGRWQATNLDAVGRMAGVTLVLTHATMPRLAPPPQAGQPAWFGEDTAPMQDDRVRYVGQPIAVVLARTSEQAEHAARALRVDYDAEPPLLGFTGEAPGSFALEVALDELAAELGLDPVELRFRNLPRDADPASGKPWTTFNLDECWRRGRETFGWAARDPRPGAMRDGDEVVGWGCATAAYLADRRKASAMAALLPDGIVEVRVASQDAGHGTYTALTIAACDSLCVSPHRVRVLLGDTDFPEAPASGGSTGLASVGPAVLAACAALKARVAAMAAADPASPVAGLAPERLTVTAGRVSAVDDALRGEDWTAPLLRFSLQRVEATADAGAGEAKKAYGTYSFGAHFIEVRVHPVLCRMRVTRYVGVFDIGRVLVPVQARSQILGGVMFGIGQALMEHGVLDRAGRLATRDLGSYHVPSCLDTPPSFSVDFIDAPDPLLNPLGTRGVGEIGVSGAAGAVANAVFHACGRRVRDLPITVEKLL